MHFDQEGKLIKIDDQNQVETVLSYEGNNLIKVVGLSGFLAFTYYDDDKIDNDKIATITDHTGRTVSYTYDGDLLTSATDPLGGVRTYAYDEQERFLNEINPEGNLMVENEYDEKDRVIKQLYADGSEMGYEYEDREVQNIKETLKTEFIAQNGVKTTYYRDIQYRTLEVEYPDHGIIQTEYNWKHQKISETDKIGPRTYYDYNDKGNLTRIENPLGEMTDLIYDEMDRLESIVSNGVVRLRSEYDNLDNLVLAEDALKRQVRFTYDKKTRGLPTHIVQPDGSVIKVKYDDRRNVIKTTDAFGVTTQFEYDTLNRVIKTIDGNGNNTQFNYDINNNITRVTNAEGNSRTYAYNKANKVTDITDFNDSNISFSYNNLNKPSTITDQLGRTTHLNYDCMWNISQITQPNGAEVNFIYDRNNRLVSIEKPDGNSVKYKYNKNDQKSQIIDENGNSTYLTYDKLQRITEVSTDEGIQYSYAYNSDGQVTSVTDAMDNVKQFVYNEGGELIQEINTLGDSRTYTYTALGKVQTVTDEAGRKTVYEYEIGGRLKNIQHPTGNIESFTYDGNGNIKTHINELELTTTYTYDCLNRLTEIITPNGGSKKYTYDEVGNVTSMTNELGYTTTYSHSPTGQLEKVIDALGFETHYTYDELDKLIEVKQFGEVDGTDGIDVNLEHMNHINETNRVTTYKRNLLGQVTSITDALGTSEHFKYSPTGQLIEKIDKEGYTTEYDYTSQGSVNYIKYEDGKEVQMAYNPLGQLIEVNDWLGVTDIDVDPLGRPLSVTNHRNEQVKYSYGKAGERRSLTYPNGKTIKYHYDDALRLTQIQDGEQFTNYIYDQQSRLVKKQYPNDTSTAYEFNELGQLQSLIHRQAGKNWQGKDTLESLDQFHYQYDLMGNKTEINRIRKGFDSKDQGRFHYQYDNLNRLTKVLQDRETLRTYEYDRFGNRVKMTENDNKSSYTYNTLNQLISKNDSKNENYDYTYDGRGNLSETYLNSQLTHKHHFGVLNRLESVFNYKQGKVALYDYNGLDQRVGKQIGLPVEPVLSETNINNIAINNQTHVEDVIDFTRPYHNLLQRSENGNNTSFTYDFNVLSAHSEIEDLHYFQDDLGSPIRLINDRGHESAFSYDEFGDITRKEGFASFDNPFTYTGYQMDNISSFYFAQAREYDPATGRFTSADPYWQPYNRISGSFGRATPSEWAIRQSGNLYDYAIGNPLKYIDLTGTDIVLPDDPEYKQRVLDELNTLVGSTGNNPILGTDTNANGNTIVTFNQPPNPNFPQSTELVRRLIDSEFTTEILAGSGVGHYTLPNYPLQAASSDHGSGSVVTFDTDWIHANDPIFTILNPDTNVSRGEATPAFIILGHELIHAERNTRGARVIGQEMNVRFNISRRRARFLWLIPLWWTFESHTESTLIEEIATIGLNNRQFNNDCDVTENDLRYEHGLDPRSGHHPFPGWEGL